MNVRHSMSQSKTRWFWSILLLLQPVNAKNNGKDSLLRRKPNEKRCWKKVSACVIKRKKMKLCVVHVHVDISAQHKKHICIFHHKSTDHNSHETIKLEYCFIRFPLRLCALLLCWLPHKNQTSPTLVSQRKEQQRGWRRAEQKKIYGRKWTNERTNGFWCNLQPFHFYSFVCIFFFILVFLPII